MKKSVILFLLFALVYCTTSDSVVEGVTKLAIPTKLDNCQLKQYGRYEGFGFVVGTGGFYECSKNGTLQGEVMTSQIYKSKFELNKYMGIIKVVVNFYYIFRLNYSQRIAIFAYMNRFDTLLYGETVIGIYNYKSSKMELYLKKQGKRELKGTYDLDMDTFKVYKKIMEERLSSSEYK